MSIESGAFWDDHAEDLKDAQFLREYVRESVRVQTTDQLVNALDEAREIAGLSKAALARAVRTEPAVVRRLFSASRVNPTLGTLAEIAAVLGMRVTLEALPAAEQRYVTAPLLEGECADTKALAKHLAGMRERSGEKVSRPSGS